MKSLILNVEERKSDELVKHATGPGRRYVFSDNQNNPQGNLYVALRAVENLQNPEQYIKPHTHDDESLLIFKGSNSDLSGLEVEVLLETEWHRIDSPKAVRIPAKLPHAFRFLRGSGECWNIVITPGADYNKTAR